MAKLDPHHHLGPDIKSFFQPPSILEPAIDGVCSLAEIPALALKTRRRGKDKGKSTDRRDVLKDRSNAGGGDNRGGRGNMGSIRKFFGPTTSSKECGDVTSGHTPTLECVDLTEAALGDFCDFSSQGNMPDLEKDDSALKPREPVQECPSLLTSAECVNETPPPSPGTLGHTDSPPPLNQSGYMDYRDDASSTELSIRSNTHMDTDISGLTDLSNISTPDESYLSAPPNGGRVETLVRKSGGPDRSDSDGTCTLSGSGGK